MTIAALANDLVAKIETVAAMATKTSLSIGGRSLDPGLLKIPLPAAWVTLKGDQVDETDYTHGPSSGLIPMSQMMMSTWAATVFVPYIDDANLLATQFPLMDAIASAVHGSEAPSGYRWRFIGRRIALVYPDRLAYEHLFTVSFAT